MNVYVDSSRLSQNPTFDECLEKLRALVPIHRALNKYRKCPRWSWVMIPGKFGPYDLCNKLRKLLKEGSVPEPQCNNAKILLRTLATGFAMCKSGSALDNASRTATLAYRIAPVEAEVVAAYSSEREVVQLLTLESLDDDAVCRILYCNHPDVPAYVTRKGYVIAKYAKHSTFPSTVRCSQDTLFRQTERSPAQFLPAYKQGTPCYDELVREVMLKAMRDGRYSEGRLNGFRCRHYEVVGASEGKMTCGVYLDMHSGNVHIYPRET